MKRNSEDVLSVFTQGAARSGFTVGPTFSGLDLDCCVFRAASVPSDERVGYLRAAAFRDPVDVAFEAAFVAAPAVFDVEAPI